MYKPKFVLTPAITKALMEIEACRQAIIRLPLSFPMLESLQRSAKLLSTHFSTQIEGNKLSSAQVGEVLEGGGHFPGRERDEAEVPLRELTAEQRKQLHSLHGYKQWLPTMWQNSSKSARGRHPRCVGNGWMPVF